MYYIAIDWLLKHPIPPVSLDEILKSDDSSSEESSAGNTEETARNPAQDKPLTGKDIKDLDKAGHDVHDLKGGKKTGQSDLYKDRQGNIYQKPKGGNGPGEPTGINLNNL